MPRFYILPGRQIYFWNNYICKANKIQGKPSLVLIALGNLNSPHCRGSYTVKNGTCSLAYIIRIKLSTIDPVALTNILSPTGECHGSNQGKSLRLYQENESVVCCTLYGVPRFENEKLTSNAVLGCHNVKNQPSIDRQHFRFWEVVLHENKALLKFQKTPSSRSLTKYEKTDSKKN